MYIGQRRDKYDTVRIVGPEGFRQITKEIGLAYSWIPKEELPDEYKKIPGIFGAVDGVLVVVDQRAPTLTINHKWGKP